MLKSLFYSLRSFVYWLLHAGFFFLVAGLIWKITLHFWPYMGYLLRLLLAVSGSSTIFYWLGVGQRFRPKEKPISDED